jgi:dihydroxyacetone kinase DhaKLM complex PTS-EIIA-like component DhaM
MSSFTSVGQMTDAMFDSIEAIHAAEDAGVDYWGTNAAEEAAKVAVQHRIENPVEVVVDNGTKVNKKQIAIDIYNSLEDKSRKAVIAALVEKGFKSSTASTYQASLKNWV